LEDYRHSSEGSIPRGVQNKLRLFCATLAQHAFILHKIQANLFALGGLPVNFKNSKYDAGIGEIHDAVFVAMHPGI